MVLSPAPAVSSDDREHGCSCVLFPPKPRQADTASVAMPNRDRSAEASRCLVIWCVAESVQSSAGDSLFVQRFSGRGLDELFEHVSQDVERFRMFECEAGQRRAPDRWMARLKQAMLAPPSGRKSVVCTLG